MTETSPSKDEGKPISNKTSDLAGLLPSDQYVTLAKSQAVQRTKTNGLLNSYDKLEVRESPIEGFGVFATADIPKGTILEEIPFILWPRYTFLGKKMYEELQQIQGRVDFISEKEKHNQEVLSMFGFKEPEKYYFKWFPPNNPTDYSVIPLGFGPIYNSSNSDNNAGWQTREKTFVFLSTRDIKKGEEVCTFYGYFLSENGATFNIPEVFGFGLDLDFSTGQVYLRSIRFMGEEDIKTRGRDAGYQKINELLGRAKNAGSLGLKIRKISVVENNQEKHPFDFPVQQTLMNDYLKLREFKHSRFKNIKFLFTYEEDKEVEKNKKRYEKGEPIVEVGEEVIITNF